MTPRGVSLVVVLGLIVRLALSWLPGTQDTHYFRMWGGLALQTGLLRVYALDDREVIRLTRQRLRGEVVRVQPIRDTGMGPFVGVPNYPPVNIAALEWSAWMARTLGAGRLRAGPLFSVCLNLLPIVASLFTILMTCRFVRTTTGRPVPGALALAWLHPAFILMSPVLGYQDTIFALLGLAALIQCHQRRLGAGILLLALACLTKPQAVLLLPVVAAVVFADGGWRACRRYAAWLGVAVVLLLLPFILAGRGLSVFVGVLMQVAYPPLSAQQLNMWWLAGGVMQAAREGWVHVLTTGIPIVSRADFGAWSGVHPLLVALPLFAAFTLGNLRRLVTAMRAGRRSAIFWAAALEVLGYNMLMVFSHEHHVFALFVYALPLLAIADHPVPRLYWGLSVLFGLNLFLFDGFGGVHTGIGQWARMAPGFDLTIAVALANTAVFLSVVATRHWWFDRTAAEGGVHVPAG